MTGVAAAGLVLLAARPGNGQVLRDGKVLNDGKILRDGKILPVTEVPTGVALPARDLQLDVRLNGQSIGLIGTFHQAEDGRFVARRSELEELGIRPPSSYGRNEAVPLAAIPSMAYRYDEATQSIDIALPDSARLPKLYDAGAAPAMAAQGGVSAYGAVLNYSLTGTSSGASAIDLWQAPGLAATLDGRVFGPLGVLSQTGLVSAPSGTLREAQALRLETVWSYSDPATMLSYRAGDVISGGLAWTRPVRLGGLQVQRNFGLRPDLITLPLPSVGGSAAVPSTVDVLVNGTKAVSQDVGSGPFRITNLPILSGNGNASVMVRDASGRQSETTVPFVVSNDLLRPGLLDVSAEIGFPRLDYGLRSGLYDESVAGSASARYGLTETVTLTAHAEATPALALAGGGAFLGLGSLGLVSGAAAASTHDGATGALLQAGFETRLAGLSFLASTQRSFGDYRDLASVATSPYGLDGTLGARFDAIAVSGSWTRFALPPRALDRLAIGLPAPAIGGSLNLGLTQLKDTNGGRTRLVNASYSRNVGGGGSFYATVFADLDRRDTIGVFAGLSFPFGQDIVASTGASRAGGSLSLAADVAKPIGQEAGSYGWRVRDVEGRSGQSLRSVQAAYRGEKGQIALGASQGAGGVAGTLQLDGAVVAAGGGIFLANRIDDAFAIAKVGAPDVDVLLENRVVARTDGSGNALVPGLRSYQANRIAIDSAALPVASLAETTQDVAAPPDRAGIIVDFAVRSTAASAIVILQGRDGKPLPAGASGTMASPDLRGVAAPAAGFQVGYDGRAFIENLAADNLITVALADGPCTARFPFAPRDAAQTTIGPVTCQ